MNQLNHIAVIMDGNGRWAQKRKLPRNIGHKHGLDKAKQVIDWCMSKGIKYVSLYVFSTENWSRPQKEIDQLFVLAGNYISRFESFCKRDIKVVITGSTDGLDEKLVSKINAIQQKTTNNTTIVVNLCLNYGGQQQVVDVCNTLVDMHLDITKDNFDKLIFSQVPAPDIILRTGGYNRLSNFFLYQCAYSEIFFSDTLWPDLTIDELDDICIKYANCSRNYGGLTNG